MNLNTHQSHQLRTGRHSARNYFYHLTSTTFQREPVFTHLTYARILIGNFRKEDDAEHTRTLAFVVMPDHFHWLIQLNNADLATVMRRVKSLTAHQVGRRIWQAGYYDRGIRREEDVRTVARYIVANPLRAELVDDLKYYPHWDAIWL